MNETNRLSEPNECVIVLMDFRTGLALGWSQPQDKFLSQCCCPQANRRGTKTINVSIVHVDFTFPITRVVSMGLRNSKPELIVH
jgi:hypothetical protein